MGFFFLPLTFVEIKNFSSLKKKKTLTLVIGKIVILCARYLLGTLDYFFFKFNTLLEMCKL